MKDHFPFTDYDFYAYLASGSILLAVLDWAFNRGAYLGLDEWNFGQIFVAIATAYVTGHIVAMFAQVTLETSLVGRLLAKPMDVQLGFKKPNLTEKLIGRAVGRFYYPLDAPTCSAIILNASTRLDCESSAITDGESVFGLAFKDSFSDEKLRHRIDGFRNQYGFCRNIAFVALVAAVIFAANAFQSGTNQDLVLSAISFMIFLAMFARFMKFLATFQAEVIRALK